MKVVYKSIKQKVKEAILKAQYGDEEIERIELTSKEFDRFRTEIDHGRERIVREAKAPELSPVYRPGMFLDPCDFVMYKTRDTIQYRGVKVVGPWK